MQAKIIEIKARCHDPDFVRDCLVLQNAEFIGMDHQVDTYFNVAKGRLKLRMGNIENSLIYYEREDQTDPKLSRVSYYRSPDARALLDVLLKVHAVLVRVEKKREIFFIDHVKFHIDKVEGLGRFVEIEAIDQVGKYSESQLLEQCESYKELFKINEEDLCSDSYSDMIMELTSQQS